MTPCGRAGCAWFWAGLWACGTAALLLGGAALLHHLPALLEWMRGPVGT